MFVSLYLLYRYARSSKSKSYLFDIGLFLVLMALVPASYPASWNSVFSLPLSFVSFPFYFWRGSLVAPVALSGVYPLLSYYSVRFLTVDLHLAPDWMLSEGLLVANPESRSIAFGVALSVLLLVNVLGGIAGYLAGKMYEVRVLSEKRWAIVGFAFLLLWFICGQAERFSEVVGERILLAAFGFGVAVFVALTVSFLIPFVKQGRIPTLMVLGGLIVLLAGQNVGRGALVQAEMTIGGQMLVVFGVLVYLLKAAIEYTRTEAPGTSKSRAEK